MMLSRVRSLSVPAQLETLRMDATHPISNPVFVNWYTHASRLTEKWAVTSAETAVALTVTAGGILGHMR